ncbi:MAG: endopeptidase La [Bacillota bacterium]|nr:endopeptidase La [Bacillota bacterium]
MPLRRQQVVPLAREVPLLPLRGLLVFPRMMMHLEVGREKSISAVTDAMDRDRRILLATQKDVEVEQPGPDDIHDVGTLAEIKQLVRLPDGNLRVLVEGLSRARILGFVRTEPSHRVRVEELPLSSESSAEIEAMTRTVTGLFEQYAKQSRRLGSDALSSVQGLTDSGEIADQITSMLNLKVEEKQALLDAADTGERLAILAEVLYREIEIMELERKISHRVRKQMEKSQREYYLREQLKAIHKELGDGGEDRAGEAAELRERIKQANLPADAEDKALKEVERLERMPPMAAEAVVVRTYLDWLLSLPWSQATDDSLDLKAAQQVLDEDHYGLVKVKERILEFLAIRHLSKDLRGPILCLVGPPGVGKTSLGKSIARALGRKFVRISLGGVRDEAEIRGHRRTYVGALPGRIIQGIRQAGSSNPVFLMDEIDKLGVDYRGDPASALLEVLDPEQNRTFSDHYLEVPFNLANVLFITTANNRHTIPQPLLDRMEVINLPGYTEEEKVQIGRRHLMGKVLREHGLSRGQLEVSDNAMRQVVSLYTREAGVRAFERHLASICRKVAREIVGGRKRLTRVPVNSLRTYLGIPPFHASEAEKRDEIGVAQALAVTEYGGTLMPIEVTLLKGKGSVMLTGKLGEVMRESAQAGLSYIRSRSEQLDIEPDFHEKYDIHVHIPEGSIPKDGPSAGITIALAVVSALARIPVRHDVAMTGEITLRGKVLGIGGIKEKVLAAHRAGIKTVIIPKENEKDLEDIPPEVRRDLEFSLVEHMDEVLEVALAGETPGAAAARVPPNAQQSLEGPVVSHHLS